MSLELWELRGAAADLVPIRGSRRHGSLALEIVRSGVAGAGMAVAVSYVYASTTSKPTAGPG